jgi:hypothetical protein
MGLARLQLTTALTAIIAMVASVVLPRAGAMFLDSSAGRHYRIG